MCMIRKRENMEIKQINRKKKFILTGLAAIMIALLAGLAAVKSFPSKLENMAQDAMYQRPDVIPDDIKIIAIDEETLNRLGPYSNWNRGYFADLVDILNKNPENAPQIIGLDIVFSGTDGSPEDTRLAEVCSRYDNIVLATTVAFDSYLYEEQDGKYYNIQYISGESKPYEALAAVTEFGFTNTPYVKGGDGIEREAFTKYVSTYEGETEVYYGFSYLIASKVGEVKDYPTRVEVAYTGRPGEFEIVSMSKVLDGVIDEEYFKDCIVLVGAYEEAMMDLFKVPIDSSRGMFGVEMHANYIHAFLNDKIIYSFSDIFLFLIAFVPVAIMAFWMMNTEIRYAAIGAPVFIVAHLLLAWVIFSFTSYKMNLLAFPMSVIVAFVGAAMLYYVEIQKKRVYEMQGMLFSMAEAMSEAIEGRTPYNANHTKNVAKRCVEMLDYINQKYKEKKTQLYFTEDDKRQLYLAAMLHDVGKMDVPLEIMDKPTKLGAREKELKDRLEIIRLRLEQDALKGVLSREEADAKQEKIRQFTESLGAFNCGRPLKEDEWALIREIAESVYVGADGTEIPYLNEEEIGDLYIKAGTLSSQEREMMQSHVVFTDKILSHIQFGKHFDKVRTMASDHHEFLNGKGYPRGIDEKELDVMTRILTIMDIYDSLIADDRPYKKAKPIKVAFDILDEEAEAGKIDRDLLVYAKELYLKDEGMK